MAQKHLQLKKDYILLKSTNCPLSVCNENLRVFIKKNKFSISGHLASSAIKSYIYPGVTLMYLNIVSVLRLPNEAISGTPQIAGPNTFRQPGEVHSSNNAKCLHSRPTSVWQHSLDKASGDFGRQIKPCTLSRWIKEELESSIYENHIKGRLLKNRTFFFPSELLVSCLCPHSKFPKLQFKKPILFCCYLFNLLSLNINYQLSFSCFKIFSKINIKGNYMLLT